MIGPLKSAPTSAVFLSLILYANVVFGHLSIWTPGMLGYNISQGTDTGVIAGENRPVDPLMNRTFVQWWFHGHLAFPPHPEDVKQMPPGQSTMFEINCDKGGTSQWRTSPAQVHNIAAPDDPNKLCPGYPTQQWHTNSYADIGGTALAVAYKSDFNAVQPDDFTVFSVNTESPWTLDTYYDVPKDMPPCPNGKCICAWFWIHRPDAGSMQMYMTGFQCNFPGATGKSPVAKGKLPRRCGPDAYSGDTNNTPSNCTVGAKLPFYWYQFEGNNMFEDTYAPPLYQPQYNFKNGAQNDIFEDSDTCGGFYPCNNKGGSTSVGGSNSIGGGQDQTTKDSTPPATTTAKVSIPISTDKPQSTGKSETTTKPANNVGDGPPATTVSESKTTDFVTTTRAIGNPGGDPPASTTLPESASATTTSQSAETSKAGRCKPQGKRNLMGRSAFASIASKHRRHIRNIFT